MDHEALGAATAALDRHLAGCADCRRWEDRAFRLRRRLTIDRPGPPPELADRVLGRVAVPDPGAGAWIRYALGVVGVSVTILNAPLLLGIRPGSDLHLSRHLGAFGVALGAGLLWAALRPERAIGLVPLAGALAVAMAAGSAVDLLAGRTVAAAESEHLLEVVGLIMLWVLSGGRRRVADRLRRWRATPTRPGLRAL